MCRLTEGVLKQFGFQKAEYHSLLCHDWLGSRHVIIGSKVGKILIMEDAELKCTTDIISLIENSDISISSVSMSDSDSSPAELKAGIRTAEHKEINALISFKGGFICSLGSGRAVVIESIMGKEDEEVKLKVAQIIKLPLRNTTTAGMNFNFVAAKYCK
jgi:alcohol dehydrogenase class IV